ncbi:MAG TPA: hypothetical protein DDW87_03230 [Firmicutes bacterium]|nr:hypothetical protein [Bacillota bacterium]
MALRDQFKWSLRHSRKQPLESLLVVIAIALGSGVIITVLSMFLSIGEQYRDIEQAEHFRVLELMGKQESTRREGAPLTLLGQDVESRDWRATLEEIEEFQENLPPTMHAYVQMHWSAKTPLLPEVENPGEEAAYRWYFDANQIFLMGTVPEYFAFSGMTLQRGDAFLSEDVKNNNRVMVLSDSLARELFGDGDPLGQVVPLIDFGEGEPLDYTVIGVFDPPESEEGASPVYENTRMAYTPVTTSPYRPAGEEPMSFQNVSIGLDVGVDIASALEGAQSEARLVWGEQIVLRSSLFEFRESQKQMQRYALLIGILASVGLVIAVINILNLMLARVLKRTKSIGLSMALGSSRALVFRQFVLEAVTLGIIGSILGILLSFALVEILEQTLGAFFVSGMWGTRVLLGIALGFIVSLLFGVYPAYLGSRTNPVDALRTD